MFSAKECDKEIEFGLFSHLPHELIHMILDHLTLKDLGNIQLVCKKWKEMIRANAIWADFCLILQHDSEPSDKHVNYYKRFKKMHGRITNPSKHFVHRKIDTGEGKVKCFHYSQGKLAVACRTLGVQGLRKLVTSNLFMDYLKD